MCMRGWWEGGSLKTPPLFLIAAAADDQFLERPASHKAHELLHTHYVPWCVAWAWVGRGPDSLPARLLQIAFACTTQPAVHPSTCCAPAAVPLLCPLQRP